MGGCAYICGKRERWSEALRLGFFTAFFLPPVSAPLELACGVRHRCLTDFLASFSAYTFDSLFSLYFSFLGRRIIACK